MSKPHFPTLVIAVVVVLAFLGLYHMALGRKR